MQLGQLTPVRPGGSFRGQISSAQKAAIIVRFLMTEGAEVPLSDLPEDLQAELAHQMGKLRRIDRDTLVSVVEEFANELEMTGLTFPKGVAGALTALDGQISPRAVAQIRKRSGVRASGDPWEKLKNLENEEILDVIASESIEISAVFISKLDVKKAAQILGDLPGEKARRITYAVSRTGAIAPGAVERIGRSLLQQIEEAPIPAFPTPPVERVGAILNSSRSATRDEVLDGLKQEDEDFAEQVRKAIFTFKHIATRVDLKDVPALLRTVDADTLTLALASALQDEKLAPSAEHILNNISARMADQLRDAVAEIGEPDPEDGENAQSEIVAAVRALADQGEILLVEEEDA